jgi:hypothetical protein
MFLPKRSDPGSRPQHAARRNSRFTIDSDNNIAMHTGSPASTENLENFTTEKELAKLAASWVEGQGTVARLLLWWHDGARPS